LICQQLAGEVKMPGGAIWEDANAAAFHVPPTEGNPKRYMGHLMIFTRRHVDHLGDLTESEAESVGRASRVLAAALRQEGVERVHVAVIGLGVGHFHEHLYPRYPGVPADTRWTSLDELPGAPHGGAAEIKSLVERLRAHL
jgi:diadenosine tetraphosphate (Ap4A) HIT family hydrolase